MSLGLKLFVILYDIGMVDLPEDTAFSFEHFPLSLCQLGMLNHLNGH
jgi:hypothetical protein